MKYVLRSLFDPQCVLSPKPLKVSDIVTVNGKELHYFSPVDQYASTLNMLTDNINHKRFYVCDNCLFAEPSKGYMEKMQQPVTFDKNYFSVPGRYQLLNNIRSQIGDITDVTKYIDSLKVIGLTLVYIADYDTHKIGVDITSGNSFTPVGGGLFQNTVQVTKNMYPKEATYIQSIPDFKIGVTTLFNSETQKLCTFARHLYKYENEHTLPHAVDDVILDITLSEELIAFDARKRKELIDEQCQSFTYVTCTKVSE